MLQLSTFALPPETPERASFSVTVLVAFGILQTIIKAEIPTTSDTVLLVIYVVGQLSVGTLATFYIVVSVGLAASFPEYYQHSREFFRKGTPGRRVYQRKTQKPGRQWQRNRKEKIIVVEDDREASIEMAGAHGKSKHYGSDVEDSADEASGDSQDSARDGRANSIINILFFQRPVLPVHTIRIMDACAFCVLAILTFVGHLTVYGLLNSAVTDDTLVVYDSE